MIQKTTLSKVLLTTMLTLAVASAQARSVEQPLLWIEAESASRREVHANAWFDAVDAQELSGGGQIANFSEPAESSGWAEYDVTVPVAGAYQFWLRANPGTGIRYRLDGGAWTKLDPQALEQED